MKGIELSHTIAKLMKYPWKQNENFHPASSCYRRLQRSSKFKI